MTLIVTLTKIGALTEEPKYLVLVIEDGPLPRTVHSLPGNYEKDEALALASALEKAFDVLGHDVSVSDCG